MDEKSDQILNHIESQRDELGRNLNELESRVKRSTDWRAHWEDNPMLLIGAALGGGVLLGAMLGGKSSSSSSSSSAPRYSSPASSSYSASEGYASGLMSSPATSQARKHASETIDKIKAALIAFGTVKAKDFLASTIPGLEQHLEGLLGSSGSNNQAQPSGSTGPGGGSHYAGSSGPSHGSANSPGYSGSGAGDNGSPGAPTGGPTSGTGMAV